MSESRGITTVVLSMSEQEGFSHYETVLEARLASSTFDGPLWPENLLAWDYQIAPPPSLSLPPRREASSREEQDKPSPDQPPGPPTSSKRSRREGLNAAGLRRELGRHVQRLQELDGQPVRLSRLWGNFNKRCTRGCFDRAVTELVSSW